MIIDAESARPAPLLFVGVIADVAEVVVGPYNRDVIGHFQSLPIKTEYFFIYAKHLGHALDLRADMLGEHRALIRENLLERPDAFGIRLGTLHIGVMDAAHPEGIYILETPILLHPLFPIRPHAVAIRY